MNKDITFLSIDSKKKDKTLRLAGQLSSSYVDTIKSHFESLGCKVNIRHTNISHVSIHITGAILTNDSTNRFLRKAPL